MEQLGAHRLELSQRGAPCPPEVPRVYADLRRLRDYLQRCVADAPEMVALDLAAPDAALLVACCRRQVDTIEAKLRSERLGGSERQLLQAKQYALGEAAVEVCSGPLIELPATGPNWQSGEAGRQLLVRLQAKRQGVEITQRRVSLERTPPPSLGAGVASAIDDSWVAPVPDEEVEAAPGLVEPRRLRDPRLRILVQLDLQSFDRARRQQDHRVAAVLLAALAEAVVIDLAQPRRTEWGLGTTPDAWNFPELLLRLLGERSQPQDRALAFQLFAARSLMRPAVQMVTPTVVTAAGLQRLTEFAQRVLHDLGLTARGGADPVTPTLALRAVPADVVLANEADAPTPDVPLLESAPVASPQFAARGDVVLSDAASPPALPPPPQPNEPAEPY